MFGRSVNRAVFLLALLLASTPALAKVHNFDSGLPFGLGFTGGFEPRPSANLIQVSTTESYYGHYFGLEPFFDFENVIIRTSFAYHFFPAATGSGSDSVGAYSDNSKSGSFDYGLKLQFVPWYPKGMRFRAFLSAGYWLTKARARNTRTYANGTSYSESVRGSGSMAAVGAGFEFFLVQNYSLQIEGGYTDRAVNSFGYFSSTDKAGVAKTQGQSVLDADFRNRALHLWGPYFQICLNLNL